MQLDDLTVEVRDVNLKRVGQILSSDLDLDATPLFNNVGSWTITLPVEHPMAGALRTAGAGIIVTGPNGPIFSGPVVSSVFSQGSDDPAGTLTITGATDEILLADALCYPTPATASVTAQSSSHDVRTGAAETVMYGYVKANIGPDAPSVRKHADLTLGTDGARGETITKSARFDQLGPFVADIATAAGLGFRIVQRGTGRVFETYQPSDKTATVRLDVDNGTLASQDATIAAPSVTEVIVGGQGDEEDRVFYLGTSATAQAAETAWGRRIEQFTSQTQTDDSTVYVQAADEILADGGGTQIGLNVVPMDDSEMEYGIDWGLGDLITAVTDQGEVASTVTGAHIIANSDNFMIGVVLGNLAVSDPSEQLNDWQNTTDDRLTVLEANTSSVPTGTVSMFAGQTAPAGYKLCNGAAVSRSTYASLFKVIGTAYGAGDGTTTFNLPNMVGAFPQGAAPGETGGSATHTHPLSDNGQANVVGNSNVILTKSANAAGSWTPGHRYPITESGSINSQTQAVGLQGRTDTGSSLPPYVGFNFIIKT